MTESTTIGQKKHLKIVMASSEAVPFSKSGGLADVTPALCRSLADAGHDVTLIVPYHREAPELRRPDCPEIHQTDVSIQVSNGQRRVSASVCWTWLPDSDVRVPLIDQPFFFGRTGLYQEHGADYQDNCERFCFFSRAVLACCEQLIIRPDVIHANDWKTALIPALLKTVKAALQVKVFMDHPIEIARSES